MSNKLEILETFENAYPGRNYYIKHRTPEFTSVCPKTGQPDFATIAIEYVPERACVELKSLKLYLQSYRNDGIYYEAVTNKILDDLVACCSPRYMKISAEFGVRGGIDSVIIAEHTAPDFIRED